MYQQVLNLAEKGKKLIILLFFASFFITSACILKDYGLNWDEEAQWKANGDIVFNYIFNEDGKKLLLESNEKYHGPAFELVLIFVEKIMQLKDTRDVYLMRHAVTFLTFFIGVIFFYLLGKRCFKNWKLALLGCVFLVLSPRIFADAFYNSKDAVFLSLFIIGMHALLVFHENQTYKNAILYALICAFTIDTRIMGVILPLISLGFAGLEFLYSLIYKKKLRIHIGSHLVFFICLVLFTILFWPVLWEGPLHHFKNAFVEMSKYHWGGFVLYRGEYLKVTNLPWHYLPVWIAITTPIPYLLLSIAGLFFIAKQFIAEPVNFIFHKKEQLLILICFFFPLLLIILLRSVVYDGWRHVFFIYPAFTLISLYGVRYVYMQLHKKQHLIAVILILVAVFNLGTIIRLHPYQYVYFNVLAGTDMKHIKEKYELDYYGVSSKQALEYLLKNDPSLKLMICAEKTPVMLNTQFLPIEQRNRIRFVDLEQADYFICQYRFHKGDYDFKNDYFSVKVGNASIMSVFKLTDEERKRADIQGVSLMKWENDFEKPLQAWTSKYITKPATGAHSGKYVTLTDSFTRYSDGLKFAVPTEWCNREDLALKVSYWKKEDMGSESSLVTTIQGNDTYFWDGKNSKALLGTKNEWDHVQVNIHLAKIQLPTDTVSVFLWNSGKKKLLLDDIKVELMQKQGEQFKIEYLK